MANLTTEKTPLDWSVAPLGARVDFLNGKAHEHLISPDGTFIVVNSKFISSNAQVIKFSNQALSIARRNDILIVMSDVPNGQAIAKCFNVGVDSLYTVNQRIGIIRSRSDCSRFLFYQLNRNLFYLAFDDGVKQTNLRKQDVLACPIVFPPLAEQEAIAEALSDADAWIESLEQLIAKKRQIKQGAMQELLEPKPYWQLVSVFDMADQQKSRFDDGDWIESEHITNKGTRLIQTGNIGVGCFIEKAERKYIYDDSFVQLKCKELLAGDLLICRLAEPAGRACVLPNIGEERVVTSVDVTIFRPRPEVCNRVFLANLFSTDMWFKQVQERVGGTTHKRIARGALGKIQVKVPKVDEQTRIGIALSDIDSEIEAIEVKLYKARQIKQAMLQELLTGRIRLVNSTATKVSMREAVNA